MLGIVRQVTHARPPGTDLIALPQPGLPRVPGVDLVERFAFDAEPGAALEVDLDADVEGWSLRVSHAGVELAALPRRPWSASPRAPLTTEFDEGVYLWSHLGNFSGGAGRGSVEVSLR